MVDAARKHNRVVQVGIQQRSGSHFQRAVELVQSGAIGKVVYAEAWNHGAARARESATWSHPRRRRVWIGICGWDRRRLRPTGTTFIRAPGACFTITAAATWPIGASTCSTSSNGRMKPDAPLSVHATGGKLWTRRRPTTPDTLNAVYEYPGVMVNYTHMNHCNYGRSEQLLRHYLPRQRRRAAAGPQRLRNRAGHGEAHRSGGRGVSRRVRRHDRHRYVLRRARAPRNTGSTSLQHVPHIAQFPGLHAFAEAPGRRYRNRLPRHPSVPAGQHLLSRTSTRSCGTRKRRRISQLRAGQRAAHQALPLAWRMAGLEA